MSTVYASALKHATGSGGVDVQGTNTNDAAAAGDVGEITTQINRPYSAKTAIATTTTINVCTTTAINIDPGDWDIHGSIGIEFSQGLFVTGIQGGVSKTSATLPSASYLNVPTGGEVRYALDNSAFFTGVADTCIQIPSYRASFAVTTPVYLVASCSFSSGTAQAWGYLEARRRR